VEYVELDVFHWLRERLEYDAELDAELREYATSDDMADSPWWTCAEAWVESRGFSGPEGTGPMVVNTYNGEDYLTQTLQYIECQDDDGNVLVVLTIHGGADVRGGYTSPRVFRPTSYDQSYSLCDNADFEVFAEPPLHELENYPEHVRLLDVPVVDRSLRGDCRGGYVEWYDVDGHNVDSVPFEVGTTPCRTTDRPDTVVIVGGPFEGWTVSFGPPYVD